MKNQYFGDIRDIFKFDLIEEIIKYEGLGIQKFLYIIMLTKDGGKGGLRRYENGIEEYYNEAKKQKRPGVKNKDLFDKMKEQANIKNGNIKNTMKQYYCKALNRDIFEAIEEPFDAPGYYNFNALTYFDKVCKQVKQYNVPSLIFFDPDTGLEPEASKGKEYISYETVEKLYNIMSDNSVVMIYQHGRQQHCNKLNTLKTITQNVLSVSDNEIVFYFLMKTEKIWENLKTVFEQYKTNYPEGKVKLG